MNKSQFIQELSKEVNLDINTCTKINEVFEKNFFISKSQKEIIIDTLRQEINLSEAKANEVYNIAKQILNREIKDKLLHPFRNNKE